MRVNTDRRVCTLRIKRKVHSCKYDEDNSRYSLEHFVITHFVNSLLKASSVTISSSLENCAAKPSEHDGSFSMVSSLALSYILGSSVDLHHMYFQCLQ